MKRVPAVVDEHAFVVRTMHQQEVDGIELVFVDKNAFVLRTMHL